MAETWLQGTINGVFTAMVDGEPWVLTDGTEANLDKPVIGHTRPLVGERCTDCGNTNNGGMQAPGGYSGCPTCGWCC